MSKVIRSVIILLLVLVAAGAVGVAKAMVTEGAIPWYLPIIVAVVLGAIIGAVLHSNSSATSAKVSDASEAGAGAENKLLKLRGAVWAGIGAVTGAVLTFLVMSNFNWPTEVRQGNQNNGNTVYSVLADAKNTVTGNETLLICDGKSIKNIPMDLTLDLDGQITIAIDGDKVEVSKYGRFKISNRDGTTWVWNRETDERKFIYRLNTISGELRKIQIYKQFYDQSKDEDVIEFDSVYQCRRVEERLIE